MRIEHTPTGTVVTLDSGGTLTFDPAGVAEFVKPQRPAEA